MFKKMINRLIGKKEVSNTVQPLVFKDNLAAFEYACSYLDTKILMNSALPAIIIPETAAIISGIVGGVFTAIDFSESFSLRRIDKTNPFNYVGEMSKKLN